MIEKGLWTTLFGYLGLLSLATFILSLLCIPLLVARLPEDVFLTQVHSKSTPKPLTIGRVMLFILKNSVGLILLVAGILMLFLPGQGLITIVIALVLLSFPGKKSLFTLLIRQPQVQHSLDWLRKKTKKPPFRWPDATIR
jgi:hypothetical protein